ncbi:MAG: hypothetical protein Q7K43_06720, partial [Candidatus Woesearchaeota archaeon]|nr:hypothetical protein [Candidatus Woesearchaeota archaeon]
IYTGRYGSRMAKTLETVEFKVSYCKDKWSKGTKPEALHPVGTASSKKDFIEADTLAKQAAGRKPYHTQGIVFEVRHAYRVYDNEEVKTAELAAKTAPAIATASKTESALARPSRATAMSRTAGAPTAGPNIGYEAATSLF